MEKEAVEGNSLDVDLAASLKEIRDNEEPDEQPEVPEEIPEEPEEADEEPDPGDEDVDPAGDSEDEIELPEHLPDDIKNDIKTLNEEQRERFLGHIKTLERGANDKFQQSAEARKFKETFDPVLEPVRPLLKQSGIAPEQYIANLIKAEASLRNNPVETIAYFIKQAGPEAIKKLQPILGIKNEEENYVDPDTKALRDEINSLKSELTNFKQQGQQAQVSEAENQIRAFAEATENGELKHPHFGKVRETMGHLANANPNLSLEQLYQKAVRLDEDIYQDIIEQEKQSVIKAREEERKKTVRQAKAASRDVKSKTSSKPAEIEESLEDTLRHTLQSIKEE